MRCIPIEWILDIRSELYRSNLSAFRKAEKNDFEVDKSYDFLLETNSQFRTLHVDWDQYLDKNMFFVLPQIQNVIEQNFSGRQSEAVVIIYIIQKIIISITSSIDFIKDINKGLADGFDKISFDEEGHCNLFEQNS